MKGSYRFTDHTADRQMVITGDPLEELYRQGVLGLRALLRGEQDFNESGRKVHRTINVESTDPTTLLVDFLSEVLTYAHIDKAVFTEVNFSQLDEKRLKAELSGYHVNGFDEEVKAVTYHEADVRKNKQGQWQSTIIFDI